MTRGRPVSSFELRPADDLPWRVGILLDLSDSTRLQWPTVRMLTESLGKLIRSEDSLFRLTFDSKVELETTVTDPSQLAALLDSSPRGGLTSLYDAIYQACGHAMFKGGQQPHRSALILFFRWRGQPEPP
jgi:hypothetical protein